MSKASALHGIDARGTGRCQDRRVKACEGDIAQHRHPDPVFSAVHVRNQPAAGCPMPETADDGPEHLGDTPPPASSGRAGLRWDPSAPAQRHDRIAGKCQAVSGGAEGGDWMAALFAASVPPRLSVPRPCRSDPLPRAMRRFHLNSSGRTKGDPVPGSAPKKLAQRAARSIAPAIAAQVRRAPASAPEPDPLGQAHCGRVATNCDHLGHAEKARMASATR